MPFYIFLVKTAHDYSTTIVPKGREKPLKPKPQLLKKIDVNC